MLGIGFKPEHGGGATIDVPDCHLAVFKELVQRATNLWPDAPPEIKRFADLVTTGTVLQKYEVEKKLTPRAKDGAYELDENPKSPTYHNCKHCGQHLVNHSCSKGNLWCPVTTTEGAIVA